MNARQFKAMAVLLGMTAGTALAADTPTLKVGDPAPKLQTGKWVQGDPVTSFQKDKAYIVEFWATWCPPCRESIPHLNEIYNKYKDKGLVVIGQDCSEQDDSKVAPFVKKMGDKMTYRVALDDKTENKRGKMAETWMAAAGQNGIPTAFLVDKTAKIAWIGHPMELKDSVIDQVLAGNYDVKKAAADYDLRQENQKKLQAAFTGFTRAMRNKDWDTANAKLDEAEKLMPEDERGNLETARFNILLGKGDYPAAYKLAEKLSDAQKDNARLQNQLAWQIATDESITQRDLGLALKCAERANTASNGKDPQILDTLARVNFMQGKKDEAIALEEKAIGLADGDVKTQLEKTLEGYKNGELTKQ